MFISDSEFKETAAKMAEQFGIDASVSENVFRSAIERVKVAASKGETITPELCEAAIVHYLEWSIKHTNDLMNNKDGCRDKLENEVLKSLQEDVLKKNTTESPICA